MLRWIAENYKTFLWAFVLAIAVWISAVTAADPDETRTLPNPVPVEIIGQSSNLVLSSDVPETVTVTLRAPNSVWDLIEADPQLVKAILDISSLSAGQHASELQIQVNARPVQIVSVVPMTVTYSLEPLITKTFPIDLSIVGEVAVGYQVEEPIAEPLQVSIAGPQSQVQKVKRVRVAVDVSGIRENFNESVNIEILDENGLLVKGLTVTPDFVHVDLPVKLQGGYRDVAVEINVVGRVASGYRLTNLSVDPPIVTVFSADPNLVNNLTGSISTQLLDLQNARNDISTRLTLVLPEGISVVGEQTVLVEASVLPIEGSVTLANELVEIVGLENGLRAQVSQISVDVILSGPLPSLETLTRQSIRASVDLTGLPPGVYQITPKIEVLVSNVVVESILPSTVEVVITAINPTPTP